MHKKLIGLFCFLFLGNYAQASELYTEQFTLSNKTPYLHIKIPKGMIAGGPTDAAVITNTFVILDSLDSSLAFFDMQGNFLKRISLPKHVHFEHIVRDEDNSLFIVGGFGDFDLQQRMVVHIQNGVITEKVIRPITKEYITNIIPDDYGLFMERTEDHFDRKKLAEVSSDDELEKVMEATNIHIEDRINRYCLSCEPKSADGLSVNGLLYRINKETNQSLLIGNQEVPLLFYPQAKNNYSEIMQVDKDGTAWVNNYIHLGSYVGVTYVWKINRLGKTIAVYRSAPDTERNWTIWPVQRNLFVSNNGAVYGMSSNKKQFKFRQLKAFSLQEMQGLAQKLDPILLKKQAEAAKRPPRKPTEFEKKYNLP